MLAPDLLNGLFELGGALLLLLNVRAVRRSRSVSGVHPLPTCFFTAWGLFNMWFYPAMGLWLSFAGGLAIVLVNLAWLLHLAWYWLVSVGDEIDAWPEGGG